MGSSSEASANSVIVEQPATTARARKRPKNLFLNEILDFLAIRESAQRDLRQRLKREMPG